MNENGKVSKRENDRNIHNVSLSTDSSNIAPTKRSPNAKTATTISTELTTLSINQYQSNLHKALLTGVTNAEAETRQKAMVIRVRIMVATDVVVITVIKIYK